MPNLCDILNTRCAAQPDKAFLLYLQDDALATVTFNQFRLEIQAWAQFFRARGIKPGDRVGFMTAKSPHQLRAFYACWWVGAIAVPICESLGDAEIAFIIRDCEPALFLSDGVCLKKLRAAAGRVPTFEFTELAASRPPASEPTTPPGAEDAVAVLIYTSGSTGMPKGVMLTHKNLCVNASSALATVGFDGSDTIMSLLPYWHSFGLLVEVILTVLNGMTVAIPRDKRDFKKNIRLYRPTVVLIVPRLADALRSGILKRIDESAAAVQDLFNQAVYNASRIFTAGPILDGGLLRMLSHHTFYDPFIFRGIRQAFGGRLRFFVSGGAPLDLEHQIFFKYVGLPIYQGYGLTEAAPAISMNTAEIHKLGSCGKPLSWLLPAHGGDFTFRAEDGSAGKHLHGELLVKGDCVMKGYWHHADASAKTLADGWLHTGDMGYVDADGFLFIEGRRSNMLVMIGGEKLHPEHVEDAVQSCELIAEAMVIGEKCKNVYACVTLNQEAIAAVPEEQRPTLIRQKIQTATAHLAPFQRPKDVLILPNFTVEDGTLTVTLKIRRFAVWQRDGEQIRTFLRDNGEELAARDQDKIGIASSKVLESLGKP